MTKNTKQNILIITIAFVVFVVFLVRIITVSLSNHKYYIFSEISECEHLIPDNKDGVTVERYSNADNDEDLKELSYEEFFGMKYKSDILEYEIFAYEFSNSDSALEYYVNVTGKKSLEKNLPLDIEDENKLWSTSSGMILFEVVVTHKNKAYKLTAPKQYEREINELISIVFSTEIL